MAESNEEPPRCPCGFWGSVQTSGLCSVCYKRQQQLTNEHEPKLFVSASNSSAPVPAITTASSGSCLTASVLSSSTSPDRQRDMPEASVTCKPPSGVAPKDSVDLSLGSTASADSTMDSDSSAAGARDDSPSRPTQKNKKRCFFCKARLELAFVEIGRCKCGYTYCELHRLPEQHACTYDHKESGRREAREKMVSPKKHVGTSLRRLDSDS